MRFFTSVYGDRYVPFLRVFLQSLIDTHPNAPVTVMWSEIEAIEIELLSIHFPKVKFDHCELGTAGIDDENLKRKTRMKRSEQKKRQPSKRGKNKPSLKLTIPSRRGRRKK